jgi:DinB superfamily
MAATVGKMAVAPDGGDMVSQVLTVDEIMTILPETPRLIATLTADLTPTELRAAPEVDAWSINDLLAHLRACHDVLGGNMLRILHEDRPTWRAMSPRTWMKQTDYPDWEFVRAFAVFQEQRTQLLSALDPLPAAAWDRTATVQGMLGTTDDKSVRYYGDWMAGHERSHWRQFGQIVAVVTGGAELNEASGRAGLPQVDLRE